MKPKALQLPPALNPMNLDQISAESVVICATQRLAQTLAQAHDALANTPTSWLTLQTSTFGQWLQHYFHDLTLRGEEPALVNDLMVLDGFQERLLWEQVIHQDLGANEAMLFDISALATTAAEAHALMINWEIEPLRNSDHYFASIEQQRFAQWQEAFLSRCAAIQRIDSARLNAALIDHLQAAHRLLPQQIVFAGFDHYTPLEQRLQATLLQVGCTLGELNDSGNRIQASRRILGTTDLAAECRAIAHWAKAQLGRRPDVRLGIVVPNVATYQYPLADALEDVIDPSLVLPRHARSQRPYNISLGQPLASTPLVQAALELLRIAAQPHAVEQSQIRNLLESPYWSSSTEQEARARLDVALRTGVAPKAPIQRYRDYAEYILHKQSLTAPALIAHLTAIDLASRKLGKTRLPSDWRQTMISILTRGGWLSDTALDSEAFQAREAFGKALDQLAQLDPITERMTFGKSVSLLSQLCAEQLFQPKTRGTPPIQILGMLEASGLHFDALWVAGLTSLAWPPAANPNPLLPIESLRAAQAPNASADVQLDFALRIQARLLESADDITLSYPCSEDGSEREASALIRDLDDEQVAEPPPVPWVAQVCARAEAPLESLRDIQAPPVRDGDRVSGGTALLKAQAICPAWGFYQYRLGAKALETPVEGLDARKRGTLTHDTLEFFWQRTVSLSALKQMSNEERRSAVESAARSALERFNENRRQEALKPRQAILEQRRLERLMEIWLQTELKREVPFSVLEAEGKREVNVAGIAAHMRIDRIDQLEDGRLLIIDYKTGADIDTRNWAGDRITEPQLPIYAAIAEHPAQTDIAGVAFGQIHLDGAGFKGINQDDGLLPNVHALDSKRGRRIFPETAFPDWASLLAHWQAAITRIAAEVHAGHAAICLTHEDDLRYCDVKPLLRLAERQRQFEKSHSVRAHDKMAHGEASQ